MRQASTDDAPPAARYWRQVLWVTAALTLLWAAITFLVPWFAPAFQFTIGGFPLGYWLTAQGALLVYLAIVVAYVVCMERLDRRYSDELPSGESPPDRDAGG